MKIAQNLLYVLILCCPLALRAMDKENTKRSRSDIAQEKHVNRMRQKSFKKPVPAVPVFAPIKTSNKPQELFNFQLNLAVLQCEPLTQAHKEALIKKINLLCQQGAQPNAPVDATNKENAPLVTPMFTAAHNLNLTALTTLLENNGNINVKNSDGQTPLHGAVTAKQKKSIAFINIQPSSLADQPQLFFVTEILKLGASPDTFDFNGKLPMDLTFDMHIRYMLQPKSLLTGSFTHNNDLEKILVNDLAYPAVLAAIIKDYIPESYIDFQRTINVQSTASNTPVTSNSSSVSYIQPLLQDITNTQHQKINNNTPHQNKTN